MTSSPSTLPSSLLVLLLPFRTSDLKSAPGPSVLQPVVIPAAEPGVVDALLGPARLTLRRELLEHVVLARTAESVCVGLLAALLPASCGPAAGVSWMFVRR